MPSNIRDFLYSEAKKIYKKILKLKKNIFNEEFYINLLNDLFNIFGFFYNDEEDEEFFNLKFTFLTIISIGIKPSLFKLDEENSQIIYYYVRYPYSKLLSYGEYLIKYIKNNFKRINIEKLRTLKLIENYDIKNNTCFSDDLKYIFIKFAKSLAKADGIITQDEKEFINYIEEIIFNNNKNMNNKNIILNRKDETLDEIMHKINNLVGMENIKKEIKNLINLIKVRQERLKNNLPVTDLTLHSVFSGPPGTGKTTIARELGKVFKCLGILKKGHVIETDRVGLVGEYIGETAQKTDRLINQAIDGVLFIDEAYALAKPENGKDFGQEAIDTILKRMEDYRDRLVVIVAGYTDEMEIFINSNPGLKSRFSRYFYFDHYKPEELMKIFEIFMKNGEYKIREEAKNKLMNLFTILYNNRDKSFGNGRLVRNIFEKILEKQATRIAHIKPKNNEILCTLEKEDIPEENEIIPIIQSKSLKIGFL